VEKTRDRCGRIAGAVTTAQGRTPIGIVLALLAAL